MSFFRALFPVPEPAPPERRERSRLRTRLRPGKLVGEDGRFLVDAAIVDRSANGARLRLFAPDDAARASALFDESEAVLRPVQAVWQAGHDAGFVFSGEPRPLDENERRRFGGRYYAVSD